MMIFYHQKTHFKWDNELNLNIDRDINAAINIKRVGLGLFPTIKRSSGKPVVVKSSTNSTAKEVLTALKSIRSPRTLRAATPT